MMMTRDRAAKSQGDADFFISYTGQDVAWARWIAAQVESAGFTVILQDWDWGPGANFVAKMHEGLQRSSRLILVTSHAYLASRWAEEEWTAAYYQGRDRVIPVCIEPLTLPGLLGPLARIDVSGLKEDDARHRLLKGLSISAGRIQPPAFPGLTDPPFPSAPWVKSGAPARNPEFRGREPQLTYIAELLDSHSVVVIAGMAGTGKTEVAGEYFHRHAGAASFAWWVPCHDEQLYVEALSLAAASLGLPSASQPIESLAVAELVEWLSSNPGWILVLDDVRDPSVPSQLLRLTQGRIIVTTTNVGWPGVGEVVQLGPWDRVDSISYLKSRLADDLGLDELSASLGDLPLALTQARSYLVATGITVDRYLELLFQRHSEVLERGDPGGHGATLTATVNLAINQLSDDARSLLLICSAYAPEPIPIEIFRSASDLADVLPGPLSDELSLEDAISDLRRLSLVRRDGPSIILHQLVQRIAIAGPEPSERRLVIARASAILASATPTWTDRPENWSQCERLLPHVLALIEHQDSSAMPEAWAWLLNRMGVYVEARGDSSLGMAMLERARDFAVQSGDRGLLGTVLNNLGNAVASLGDLDRGIELVEQGLSEKRAGNASPMILARAIGALGSLARRKGDFAKAIELHREALQLLERDPEADDYVRAAECNDIGVCATELGLFDEALAMHGRALETFERIQGANGLEVGRTHAALALLHQETGNLGKALAHQERALEILESNLESRHPDLGPLLSQLGLILIDLDRNEEAREVLERALSIAEERLGPDHVEVGFRLGNLGIALMKLGTLDESIRAHERSLALLRSRLGDGHRSVAIQRANLAAALSERGERGRAQELLQQAIYGLLSLPPAPLLSELVDIYTDRLLETGEEKKAEPLLDDLIEYMERLDEPRRSTGFAWVAAICAKLDDRKRLVLCLQRQRPA